MRIVNYFKHISDCLFLENEELSKYSYWKIGGQAKLIALPSSIEAIQKIRIEAKHLNVPCVIIGAGSNILYDDNGFNGVLVKIGQNFSDVILTSNKIIAQSGIFVPHLARISQVHGFTGLEHCIGIPGTLGGLVSMNGGSKRKAISDSIEFITVINSDNTVSKLTKNDCDFSYRHSRFLNSDEIIVSVSLTFNRKDKNTVRNEMLEILKSRNARFPRKLPNCGSVFKSDPKIYDQHGAPGFLIEQCGLKGYSEGGAQINQQHANFFINSGNASCQDILHLVKHVRNKVFNKYGVWLEGEARHLSPEGLFMPLHLKAETFDRE